MKTKKELIYWINKNLELVETESSDALFDQMQSQSGECLQSFAVRQVKIQIADKSSISLRMRMADGFSTSVPVMAGRL